VLERHRLGLGAAWTSHPDAEHVLHAAASSAPGLGHALAELGCRRPPPAAPVPKRHRRGPPAASNGTRSGHRPPAHQRDAVKISDRPQPQGAPRRAPRGDGRRRGPADAAADPARDQMSNVPRTRPRPDRLTARPASRSREPRADCRSGRLLQRVQGCRAWSVVERDQPARWGTRARKRDPPRRAPNGRRSVPVAVAHIGGVVQPARPRWSTPCTITATTSSCRRSRGRDDGDPRRRAAGLTSRVIRHVHPCCSSGRQRAVHGSAAARK